MGIMLRFGAGHDPERTCGQQRNDQYPECKRHDIAAATGIGVEIFESGDVVGQKFPDITGSAGEDCLC